MKFLVLILAFGSSPSTGLAFGRKKPEPFPVTRLAPLPDGQSWVDEPLSQWMEQLAREPVTDGNRITFLKDGDEFFPVRLRMIRQARVGDTLDVSTFLWCDDPAGLLVAEELARAAGRGVRVRAIVDYLNAFNGPHERVYATLRNARIPLIEFNPPYWGLDQVNSSRVHEKMMILNGSEALVGGANLCDEYLEGRHKKLWHEFELHAEGPVVGRIQARYDDVFNYMSDTDYSVRWGYQPVLNDPDHMPRVFRRYPRYEHPTPVRAKPTGKARAMFVYQQPYRDREHTRNFLSLFSGLAGRATRRLVVYIPYFVSPKAFESALVETARGGVRVILMTNSRWSNDTGLIVALAAYGHYKRILEAGVEIYEIQKTALHGKAMLVDDTLLAVGSHNFDNRSFRTQGETSILTGDQAAIAKFAAMAEAERADWRRLTLRDVDLARSAGGILSLLGTAFERFF